MTVLPRGALAALVAAGLVVSSLSAQAPAATRPLDHADYDLWTDIGQERLSPDGRWLAYVARSGHADPVLGIVDLESGRRLDLARGTGPRFTGDGRWLVALVEAAEHSAVGAGAPDTLALVPLEEALGAEGPHPEAVARIASVESFEVSPDGAPLVAWRGAPSQDGTLVFRDLDSRRESRLEGVESYAMGADGGVWALTRSTSRHPAGVHRVPAPGAPPLTPLSGEGRFRGLAVDATGRRAAFLTDRDADETGGWALWAVDADGGFRRLAAAGEPGLPEGWRLTDVEPPRFSAGGGRVLFAAAPADGPEARPEARTVEVDVWSWTDPYLQSHQLAERREPDEVAYTAAVPALGGPVVTLEDPELPDVLLPAEGDGPVALGIDGQRWGPLLSWDGRYVDAWLVDPDTGERTRVLEKVADRPRLSPTGRWLTWWDGENRRWMALDARRPGEPVDLTARIPRPVHDETHDRPGPPDPHGLAGWTPGDRALLLYDAFDVWAVDPERPASPRIVTAGLGRREGVRLRIAGADGGRVPLRGADTLLLAAFDVDTRAAGFYRGRLDAPGDPVRLLLSDHHYSTPVAAADGSRLLFTRERFDESPDLWVAGPDLSDARRVTDENPQQALFRWGTAELVSWTGPRGEARRGVLYRPDGLDTTRAHPTLVHFYERSSDDLHRYHAPGAGASSVNRSFYVSRGYVVFVPDVTYEVGHPGESAVDAVVSGVQALVDRGIADPGGIGVQGHSWGGYQVAYLVTRTDLFAAAGAGAPVANMTSAYASIRPASGLSRMVQYERSQSRIGGTLWEELPLYLENSPLFAADRVETPLLMLHNDGDGAVPFQQGIELFTALRRLEKPAWLLNYNGEGHGLGREANRRDWAVRMQQFFDHYLKGAPPPVWMARGVPARLKGVTLGLDLAPPSDSLARRPRPEGR